MGGEQEGEGQEPEATEEAPMEEDSKQEEEGILSWQLAWGGGLAAQGCSHRFFISPPPYYPSPKNFSAPPYYLPLH